MKNQKFKMTEKIQKSVGIELFGTLWEFSGSLKDFKNLSEAQLKKYIMQTIVGIDRDNSNKNVLLVYIPSDIGTHYMSFKFAVEMDFKMQSIANQGYLQDYKKELI